MSRNPLVNRRTRIVNFRLTEHEYARLKSACLERGGNCLSDFARTAVLAYAQGGLAPDLIVQQRLLTVEHKLSAIGQRLQELLTKAGGVIPNS